MDVSNLLSREDSSFGVRKAIKREDPPLTSPHRVQSTNPPTHIVQPMVNSTINMAGTSLRSQASRELARPSPNKGKLQKHVTFELLLPVSQHRARLPMRIMISPHDTTDSIITTVKNFYGLYEGPGVSFEDKEGNILIAAYDNFENNMTIYVRVIPEDPAIAAAKEPSPRTSASPRKPKLGAPFEMRPPAQPTRPHVRSPSPTTHRSEPLAMSGKSRMRIQKSQESNGPLDDYSDSDGGAGSVNSSRRDNHASAEISVDNIVEGGRRKRAKFESSELPLFVPPQVPMTASLSSVSPQRRGPGESVASPLPFSNQRTFVYSQPLPSPQSYGRSEGQYMPSGQPLGVYAHGLPYNGHQLRGRGPITYQPPRRSTGGILPTPEPTVGSVISDEDVALQLMRLGDVANYSHGRTSTSTLDDALSGKAEVASSDGESEDEEEDHSINRQASTHDHFAGPPRKRQRMVGGHHDPDGFSSGEDYNDDSFKGDSDGIMPDGAHRPTVSRTSSKPKAPKSRGSISSATDTAKSGKIRTPVSISSKVKAGSSKVPMSPASLPSGSRKASFASSANFQGPVGPDEEDLSAKPRCQRCRKSKKGCDRQRPCGRCKDAGIGVEGCVSEDEGNGRRGRYGRHMGVPIKKDANGVSEEPESSFASPSHGQFLAPALPVDKSKKRKR